ncbi:TonB-dependent siderophore receptor [Methylobacillus caricis]|uniref:TonB-dependent siderophore receptor n=1 Tax=Methylobacillus caricis TaxID=1971611 RepID=UPI001CFF6325|nr:TonB-dependent siderophore receptor [Methylobacillus caricis]MCB5188571.1 TonB-dependent siderophore receptor [Methylobacillus caricis]
MILAVMLAVSVLDVTTHSAMAADAIEKNDKRYYDLPASSLAATLNQIARETGAVLTVDATLLANKKSAPVRGDFTPQQALQQALLGTGLALVTTDIGSFSLKVAAIAGSSTRADTLPEVNVVARAQNGRWTTTTEGTRSYASNVVSIGKGELALKDIPQSVSVLTRQRMDDMGITDLRDAANTVTGVVGVAGVGQGMVLSSRGFQIDAWQYDGVPIPRNTYALGNWGAEGMVFFDRLEVLRGASGLLQGTGSPGGAINLVRKRGQLEKTIVMTVKAGSWDHYGLQLDAGGPLNEEGSLRGRIVIDEDRTKSFIDYVWQNTQSLYAALDYDLGPDTTIGIGISNSDSDSRPMIRGLPRYPDGSDIGLPRSTYVGAVWNRAEIDQTTLYADLEHHFNSDWKVKVSALRMRERNTSVHQRMHGDVAADGSGLTFANWATDFDATKTGLDMYVRGQFEAFALKNEVTLGANYSKYTSNDMWARTFTPGGNIFAIDHHRPWQNYASIMAAGGIDSFTNYDVRQKGIYGSWRIRLTEPLTAIVGARTSWYDYSYAKPSTNYEAVNNVAGEVTPYLGLVYALNDQWSMYASYTDVFEPQSERNLSGKSLDPIIGSNYELGIKGELMGGRANASLALFRYNHENRAVTDYASGFACSGSYCSVASGKVRSEGVEAEVSGEAVAGFQLAAGYTFNTTKFINDPVNEGKVFSQWTPKHMLRIWANYQLPGEWRKLSLGGGVNAQSYTLGYNREYEVPGFSVLNARMAYQVTPEVLLALNLNNILDKRYYIPAFNETNGNNMYGTPRNAMLTLKYSY